MNEHGFVRAALTFAPIGEGWHDFYMLAGTAAVTLVGLLFVALSLHVEILFRRGHEDFREMAGQAFQGYLYVLMTALVFLVPASDRRWQLLTYGFLNVLMLIRAAWRIPVFMKARKARAASAAGAVASHHAKRFPLPFVAYALGILAVAESLKDTPGASVSLLAPVLLMLTSATRTAWDLLEYVGRTRQATEGGPPDPGSLR